MAVVNTNIGASIAQAALMRNERALSTAMEQLSTGKKINSAGDNAAGLAISTRMTTQIQGLGAAIRNASDAISMINTAEGAVDEITNMLQRMRELAVQAGTGTTDSADRGYLHQEYVALRGEIDRIAENTQWNGRNILDGNAGVTATYGASKVTFQIGANPSQGFSTGFGDFTDGSGIMSFIAASTQLNTGTIASAIQESSRAIVALDTAISEVSSQRAKFGAATNRLTHTIDNLTNIKTNSESSRSRILDTDYAAATSELARTQIIQQAGTAMLAQANQLPQTVLALLQ